MFPFSLMKWGPFDFDGNRGSQFLFFIVFSSINLSAWPFSFAALSHGTPG
jgi:hypothetical protein